MNLGSTLRTTFSTAKPLTGEPMNSDVAIVLTVYRNGVLFAPLVAPVLANPAVGQYTITHALTAANGYALNDWVTIAATCVLDGITVRVPVWEGSLTVLYSDVVCILGQTVYPMFTTHQPSTGQNQDPDGGAGVLTMQVYRGLVLIAQVPGLGNPFVGGYIMSLPITAVLGWATGDQVDIAVTATVDGIAKISWVFSGGQVVASAGGGGVPRHEVIGHALRFQ